MPMKILIVEDDAINVKFMKVVLQKKGGFEVLVSEDVEEILHLAASGEIAAIIMDISLSRSTWEGRNVDGVFITRLLKSRPESAGVPVILAGLLAVGGALLGERALDLRLHTAPARDAFGRAA